MAVFVLDRRKKTLMSCSEKHARFLLKTRRARVHRLVPFTIRLVDCARDKNVLYPGSKTAGGIAVVRVDKSLEEEIMGTRAN